MNSISLEKFVKLGAKTNYSKFSISRSFRWSLHVIALLWFWLQVNVKMKFLFAEQVDMLLNYGEPQ